MADLISRQAAIDAITKYCTQFDLRELLADFDGIPSAQPKILACGQGELVDIDPERKRGNWNYIQAGMAVCPYCGAKQDNYFKNFCPNCGADMRGEQDGD